MKRIQAMYKQGQTNNSGGQTTPASFPPGWDDTKKIFIDYKTITRADHLTLPYWSDFVEYCENIDNTWTLNDWLGVIDSTSNCSDIGITKLKFYPLTDVVLPGRWLYNSDYSDGSISARWTSGNQGFKIYSFYHLSHTQSDWSSLKQTKESGLRLLKLSKLLNTLTLYTDQNATVDVPITNRNLLRYYGTTIKGQGGGAVWAGIFRIGANDNLKDIQVPWANAYSQRARTQFYDYFKNFNDNTEPFDSYDLSDQIEVWYDPNRTQIENTITLDAAPFAFKKVKVYEETVSGIIHRIWANIVILLVINDTTERNILT